MIEVAIDPRLSAGPLAGLATFALLAGGRFPRPQPNLIGRAMVVRWAGLAMRSALEEAVWRGLVLGALLGLVGPGVALTVSAVGFALWHRRILGRRCAVHLVTGSVFGAAFLAGGLTAAILAHATYNLLVDWAVHAERARLRAP